MNPHGEPLVWLQGEIGTPPFSPEARIEAGYLLRLLQQGYRLGMPHSRPMPVIGQRGHELRIKDKSHEWRIVYRMDADAIVIADVFTKTTRTTPMRVVAECKRRLRLFDAVK